MACLFVFVLPSSLALEVAMLLYAAIQKYYYSETFYVQMFYIFLKNFFSLSFFDICFAST